MPFNIGGFTYDSTFIQNYTKGGIVTDGLVLHLDAAYANSYPKGGTTWYDLSGNGNHGTLTNGPTYNSANGGSIIFDGSNDEVISTNNASLQITVGTISAWVYATNANTAVHGIIAKQSAWGLFVWENTLRAYDWGNGIARNTGITIGNNNWYHVAMTFTETIGTPSNNAIIYLNGISVLTTTIKHSNHNQTVQVGEANASQHLNGNIGIVCIYNRALSASEILQNYNATRYRFSIYEDMTYTSNGDITITGNGSQSVSMFKTSGTSAWDRHVYSTQPFTAPCTIEFYKSAGSTDNSVSYAMIGWNSDPTTNASYDTLDWAAYPYRTDLYQVYHNGSNVHSSGTWDPNKKFYIVYDTDGWIRHYNGSTLLYSANKGTGGTVYVDSAYYSVNSTFGGFSSVKVSKKSWNGTSYV